MAPATGSITKIASNTLLQNVDQPNAYPVADTHRPLPPRHVAILDDDPGVRTLLCRLLKESGYEVTGVESGNQLQELLKTRVVDLILLDIMLSNESGLDICQSIRSVSSVPVVMISARDHERDRVTGLDLGADDYIAKPFGRSELLARVRAVLRRIDGAHVVHNAPAPEKFGFAGWHYRPRQLELISPLGTEVELTTAEHELLLTLLRYPQRMIGRERLLEMTRARIHNPSDRSIDVLVSRLRRKLGDGRRARPIIRTVRGVGYMLTAEVDIQ